MKGSHVEESSTESVHPDGRLVMRVRRGDLDGLGELYEKYKAQVFRTALAITKDRGTAEDILQECFLRLFNYADRLKTDVPLGPWLYRVTVNLSYTWIQQHQRRTSPLEYVLDRLKSPLSLLPERLVEGLEVRDKVRRAIESLPPGHQVVVVLFYLEGLSLKEIADVLEIPEGTVKSRLHYARKSLREQLSDREKVAGMAYEFT